MKAWFAKYWKWLAVAALLIAVSAAWSFLPFGEWIKGFIGWVEKRGPLGVVVFVAIYAMATVLFLPGSLLTIAAGLVFGLLIGTLAASAGSIHRGVMRVPDRPLLRPQLHRGDGQARRKVPRDR